MLKFLGFLLLIWIVLICVGALVSTIWFFVKVGFAVFCLGLVCLSLKVVWNALFG